MKRIITSLITIGASILMNAQTVEFQVTVTQDMDLDTATWTNSVNILFCESAANTNDSLDMTAPITDSLEMHPFTRNSSSTPLLVCDSRPQLRADRKIPFGVWHQNSGDLHIRGQWTTGDSSLYDVYLYDPSTGMLYDLYSEQTLSLAGNTNYAVRLSIWFFSKAGVTTSNESCFGSNDGYLNIESPAIEWDLEVYQDTTPVAALFVLDNDTFLQNLAPGTYTLVYSLDGNVVDTITTTIAAAVQVISSASVNDTTAAVGQTVTFSNTSTGATTYAWNFGDGDTSTAVSPAHAYASIGTYTITLIAYNAAGCNSTVTYTVDVQATTLAPLPLPLDRNNQQTQNTARESAVSVKSENGTAQVAMNDDAVITQFSVYSMNGQLLYTGSGNDNTFTYDTPGIYTIRIIYSDGTTDARQWFLN